MRGARLILVFVAAGVIGPADALAQRGGFNPEQGFQNWDTNKDGVVTRDEIRTTWDRDRFEDYLRRAGSTDGRLTKDGYLKAFQERMNERAGFRGGFGGGAPGGRPRFDPAQFEAMFKNFDRNGDGKIDKDEIQRTATLKNEVATWDTTKDGAIDLAEWKVYLDSANKGLTSPGGAAPPPVGPTPAPNGTTPPATTPTDPMAEPKKETPAAPTVFRAGQLPSEGLPSWFKDLDKDNDGQVALHEWPADRPMKEFEDADRNGDGLVTIAEGLRFTRMGNGKANGGGEPSKDKDPKDKDKDGDGRDRDRRRR